MIRRKDVDYVTRLSQPGLEQTKGGPVAQLIPADLEAALKQATENYQATWQQVDTELYDLCRRRPSQRNFADVYPKVAMIGRVYAAGIARTVRVSGDREATVARGLIEQADLIDAALNVLEGKQFDRATAAQIIELHGRVTKGIKPHTGGVWLTSFVSKYLHFHCPLVPIYDSIATGAIGRFINWHAVAQVRALLMDLPDCAWAYRNYVGAFVVLYEQALADTPLQPSVRDIDYLLWQPAPGEVDAASGQQGVWPAQVTRSGPTWTGKAS